MDSIREQLEIRGYDLQTFYQETDISYNVARELWNGETRESRTYKTKEAVADTLGVDVTDVNQMLRSN